MANPPNDDPPSPVESRVDSRPVGPVDERFQFLDQKPSVSAQPAPAAALASRARIDDAACRSVFVNALTAGIGHRHDDERLDQLLFNQALGRFICAPLNSGIGGRGIENILAIVQIEHRITPPPSASPNRAAGKPERRAGCAECGTRTADVTE